MKIKKKKRKSNVKKNINETRNKIKKVKISRKWWKRLLSLFIVFFCIGVICVFAFCVYIVSTTGEFDPNALANQDKTIIYDSNNKEIASLGMEQRESVHYDDLPQVLIDAIVATEDSRFYQHNGVDAPRFMKAAFGQVLGNSSAGGASTLTMQVVKNNLTSTEQTITRKFKDVYLAVFFMEKKYTKEEIFEFYVNDSYLGGHAYGVEEASKYYFGKSVSQLSLPEAAIIAGLFQAPSSYNPYNNPERTKARLNTVLKLMVKHGYITKEEADIASSIDITSLLANNNNEVLYQGFIDYVIEEVEKKTGNDPNTVSMEIHTTLNTSIQDGLNDIFAGKTNYTWVNDVVQAGVSIVDVKTGAIAALGTGRNRNGQRLYSYATSAKRQPGSTAKPIFAYGPGFEYDNFSTYQLFVDEDWSYSNGASLGNWDNSYKGVMTLKQALSISRNVPAVKAFQTVQSDVGNAKIKEFVNNLGMNLDEVYESYSIGGLSKGVTTLQMASAYAAFANGGYYTEPYSVTSITYRSTGEKIDYEAKRTQAMKESTAYLLTNVLEYAAHYGFSGGTSGYAGTVAVKTGTSNYSDETLRKYHLPGSAVNDLWTVAYTPEYSIALWYGYDEVSSEYYSSASYPKENLMAAVMKYIPVCTDAFKIPSSVTASKVEFGTWPAELPSEYTPGDLVMTEYFVSGTEPADVSKRFDKLSPVSNLKASTVANGTKLTWNFNGTDPTSDSYLKNYYSNAIWGKSGNRLMDERKAYNAGTLGSFGFGIYIEDSNGQQKEVGFTTNKNYTYTGNVSGNVTFVVKTEYQNFKSNASTPTSVKANVAKKNNDVSNDENSNLKVTVGNSTECSIGEYVDDLKVSYNNTDVTSNSKTKYNIQVKIDNTTKTFTSISALESAINAISNTGTYNVEYKISYENDTVVKKKSITIK